MKKKYLFPLAMAGLLLGACSNDDISESPNGGGTTTSPDEGFVAVSINLPMVSGASFPWLRTISSQTVWIVNMK